MSGRLAGGRPVSTVCMASPAIHGGRAGDPHRSQAIPDYTNDESHHLQSFLVSYEKEAVTGEWVGHRKIRQIKS